MPADDFSRLLPGVAREGKADAYQVFGLSGPLDDEARIKSAIKTTVLRMKGLRASVDGESFRDAARQVAAAKEVLLDPQQKRSLDQRLRAADPLAGILPTMPSATTKAREVETREVETREPEVGNTQIATTQPAAMPAGGVQMPGPVSKEGSHPISTEISHPFESGGQTIVRPRSRRRRSKLPVALILIVLVLAGITAALGSRYFRQPQMTQTTTGTTSPPTAPRVAPPPPPRTRQPPADPVMGNLAADKPTVAPESSPLTGIEIGSGASDANLDFSASEIDAINSLNSMDAMSSMDDTAAMNSNDAAATPTPATAMASPATDMATPATDMAMSPTDSAAIDELVKVIAARDWANMKKRAETLRDQMTSERETQRIEALYRIADLASFYRGGIQRGLATLNAGNDFEVVPGFRVIVVSVTGEQLEIQFDRKNFAYTVDELPTVIADKLASFSISESVNRNAAAAIYHFLQNRDDASIRESELNFLRTKSFDLDGLSSQFIADELQRMADGRTK